MHEKLIYMCKKYVAKKAQSFTLDKIKTSQIASKDDAAAHPKNDETANPNNDDIARVWLEIPDETKALINQLINSDGGVLTRTKTITSFWLVLLVVSKLEKLQQHLQLQHPTKILKLQQCWRMHLRVQHM
jgi:hypothetical protein